jgi:malate dehydrogenase
LNNKRVGIVGVGNVGATLAFTLATKNICSSLLLKDLRENIVQAMALDISQATNAAKSKTIVQSCIKDEEFKDCDIVVITAGIARKPGMSRDDLLLTNAKIMTSVINNVTKYNPNAVIIIVSNPLDAMVYTALKVSNWPRNKIIGMAGILDSARMAHFIFEKLGYGQGQIEASVMGGHGDDMVPLADFSTVAGVNLSEVLSKKDIDDIVFKTKNGGAQIVKLLETGSAYYAPAYSTTLMIEAILNNKREVYPCAVRLEGEYGYNNIVSGVPVMLGSNGIEKIIELNLKDEQKNQFSKSIASVKELVDTLENKFFNNTL